MHRSIVVALLLLLFAAAAGWFLTRTDVAPPPAPEANPPIAETNGGIRPQQGGTGADVDNGGAARQMVAATNGELLDDPDIRSSLTGFRGRVVDFRLQPVAGCGVRIYRGNFDSILPEGLDLFAETTDWRPNYIAGDTRTAADGTFAIDGVWPRGLYLLHAGIGTDAPMHQVLSRTPSPGEVVDLGDVVLPNSGVVTGTVQGDDGEPLVGALVRAADLPGSLAGLFPVERFDPEGALLLREAGPQVRVLEMPSWVKRVFDDLPFPSCLTDGEGHFRLVGVTPGTNLLATTCRTYLSDMKAGIQVRAGQEKNVGVIRLRRGEELVGRVVDTKGEPVDNAEVLAGSVLSIVPFDFAQHLANTDAKGRFNGFGFSAGKVSVAARRGKGHAWVLADPQAIAGEVTVTLPATFALTATVVTKDGQPVKSPRFRLLQGRAGEGAAEMALLGFAPPITLGERTHSLADGQWRFDNLLVGEYTLLADAPGLATAFASAVVANQDATVRLELGEPKRFSVRVETAQGEPIRNATIYGQGRGTGSTLDMPLNCGRTGRDGRLVIDKMQGETLRASAEHPKWGTVGGEAKLGEELVLRMQAPGVLEGLVVEDRKPSLPGKWTVGLMRRRGDEPRGAIEDVPMLLSPGIAGTFRAVLQPGSYDVTTVASLEMIRSAGSVIGFANDLGLNRNNKHTEVVLNAGETTHVEIEAGTPPIDGPTARLGGTVFIDGRPAVGYSLFANGRGHRAGARTDENGRFDFAQVQAGSEIELSVIGSNSNVGMMFDTLWSQNVTLTEGEARELPIEIATSSISGVCSYEDGRPAARITVRAIGQIEAAGRQGSAVNATTDENGAFVFSQIPAGTWQLQARGEDSSVGTVKDFAVRIGAPVTGMQVTLRKTVAVKGRVDLQPLAAGKQEWVWLSCEQATASPGSGAGGSGSSIDRANGEFRLRNLVPGRYRMVLNTSEGRYECGELDVPVTGLDNVSLTIGPKLP